MLDFEAVTGLIPMGFHQFSIPHVVRKPNYLVTEDVLYLVSSILVSAHWSLLFLWFLFAKP